MRSRLLWVSIATAVLAGALVAGWTVHRPRPARQAAPPPAVASPAAAGAFGATDVAWLQLMIPMDEQALALLDLVPSRTTDRAAAEVAARIGAGHRAELADLRALRDRAGLPDTNVHAGHDLPGMVTPAELAEIGRHRGSAFVTRFTSTLLEHLDQGVLVCAGERDAGTDPATKALAAAAQNRRRADLDLLAGLPGGATGGTPGGPAS
ncbi:DUF305 domain-containing protein [Rhizomonospora bruguierae]|uniref:DUF305 domain-containing protein n=1 Tax=Rhizomonospora bruguierae TaxID=1581705 RepID=UPI0020BE6884|nr:DUF305 domain-containing protein [Micromonospora sp. NBRC 107566]